MAEMFTTDGHEVTMIDCASTYPPLLDWYNTIEKGTDIKLVRLPNLGCRAAWIGKVVTHLREPYVASDPDYDLSMIPKDWPEVLMEGLHRYPEHVKFGLSWDESQVPQENPAWTLDEFDKYPQGLPRMWQRPLPGGWQDHPTDTSFALYRHSDMSGINGIRKDRPYTGVHMPWHITLDPAKDPSKRYVLMDDEIYYYFTHVENSSCTVGRLTAMLAEYKRRKGI